MGKGWTMPHSGRSGSRWLALWQQGGECATTVANRGIENERTAPKDGPFSCVELRGVAERCEALSCDAECCGAVPKLIRCAKQVERLNGPQ